MYGTFPVCRAIRHVILAHLIETYGRERVCDALETIGANNTMGDADHDPVIHITLIDGSPPGDVGVHDWYTQAIAAAFGLPPDLIENEVKDG